jgi:hypothetical protein
MLVFAAGHWLHPAAAAAGCRAAARERQGDCESQTKADFSEDTVFRFHNCVFLLLIFFVPANVAFANSFLAAVA